MPTTLEQPPTAMPSSNVPVDSGSLLPHKLARSRPLFDPEIVRRATKESFVKLNPLTLAKNPVMFVVEVGAALTTLFLIRDLFTHGAEISFQFQISIWLWFTVLFANFAEAMAEARGKAQADTLRKTKSDSQAKRIVSNDKIEIVASSKLRAGDIVIAETGDLIPGDGEVIDGIATVDESVITGESAPVIRESGGDRSAVTGGTKVLSDKVKIRITSNPGETFLDKMIALVEGAERQKTPNEIALNILIAGLPLSFSGGGHPASICSICGEFIRRRACPQHRGARFFAGLPDSHHHWRFALRYRHRRYGPRHATQRSRHEWQSSRSFGRYQYSASR